MKKKSDFGEFFSRCRKDKIYLIMKQMLFLLFALNLSVLAETRAQKVTAFSVKNADLKNCILKIKKMTGVGFLYNGQELEKVTGISLTLKDADLTVVMDRLLEGTGFTYRVMDGVIAIMKKSAMAVDSLKVHRIRGVVKDKKGEPCPGVTVLVKGTRLGVATDHDGNFMLDVPTKGDVALVFSFIGMKTQEIPYKGQTLLNVVLEEETSVLEETVVTGYFERNKNTFTGAVKMVTGDEILKVSKTNLINALSILDPAIQIVQNNIQGSNPNSLPNLIIRGTTSLNTSDEVGLNAPLIVIDGVESSLVALYDMDINDIESVTILKDASATALYGEQAANGVILVNRKRSLEKALRMSYNFTGKVEFADVSDYNLMNAAEKLDYEVYSGLYEDQTGAKYASYLQKLKNVNSGIDTDWISKPLRNSFSHDHSLNLSGEGSSVYYQVSARYGSTNGVMKDDNRNNIGVGFYLSHNLNSSLITTLRANYSQTKSEDSKYGNFQDFVNANPYDAPYDEEGDLLKELSYNLPNPLYESTLSSFSKSKTKVLTASLNVRWNIMRGLYMTGFGSIMSTDRRSDRYRSPDSQRFNGVSDPQRKGAYSLSSSEGNNYLLKFTANYFRNLDKKGSSVTVNGGGELRRERTLPYSFTVEGFFNDELSEPVFGSGFPQGSRVSGSASSESVSIAWVAAANLNFRGRYYADLSYRLSGSSLFGKDKRYAPYWSVGLGWNLHKERFAENVGWVNLMRVRGSYGYTGSMNFQAYQAMTTYEYDSQWIQKNGLGAVPKTMGNRDLKWQTTKTLNVGFNSTLCGNRLDVNFDYYDTRTINMIVPISMPLSTGVDEVMANVGEQRNKGYEFSVSGVLLKRDELSWRVTVNAGHNKNKLVKVGDVLKRQNEANASNNNQVARISNLGGINPLELYIEGQPSSMLYVVRSAGIDPASGQEIYITKDGQLTYTYNPQDKVGVGDKEPKLRGALSTNLFYKGFSLNVSLQYSLGGYMYNYTRWQRIEKIEAKYNADKRAYAQRWKQAGDVVNYLSIYPKSSGMMDYYHSERFVEKENYLNLSYISLGYEFKDQVLERIGLKRLSLSVSMNDIARFSTIKQERGAYYPFARGFSFTISPTF